MTVTPVPNEADRLNGVLSVTGGDLERARQLRANIAIFARRLGDPEMTRMVNEVLAGRRNVREIFRTTQFRDVASRNFDHLEQGLERLPPGVADRMLAEAAERADRLSDAGSSAEEDVETEIAESRLHRLRDEDLPSSPVGPTGDVEPADDGRPGAVRRF